MQLEGLGKLKKIIHLIEYRTSDFPACNIVSQPNTLPRDPRTYLQLSHTNLKTYP
jgi:hypothetical protein